VATTTSARDLAHSRSRLHRAQWAAEAFGAYDYSTVKRIVTAVADVAYNNAGRFAEMTVKECGFGVVADKVVKNQTASRGFVQQYAERDLCSHRIDAAARQIQVPRPAGVVLAVIPSTSPIAALYFKTLSALLTRNAIVISPHPAVVSTCVEAARIVARAAKSAGAPDGCIQVIERPTIPLIEALMGDQLTNLIVATGGSQVVRAAYLSGTPAIGVGPGNPPVLVDDTADLGRAAECIVASKTFDNSVLCTAESLLIAVEPIAAELTSRMTKLGAHICSEDETAKVRDYVYPGGAFNTKVVGRSAAEIASAAGFRVAPTVKVLVTPIHSVTVEESLTHEKLSPVLAMRTVPDISRAIREARSLLRIAGSGHSAVIHSTNPQNILDLSSGLSAHRMAVNVPGSLGNAGMGTTLPMTFSVGTGFRAGSSTGDNFTPDHLVQWSRTAFSEAADVVFPDFGGLTPRTHRHISEHVPPYPLPSNRLETSVALDGAPRAASQPGEADVSSLREDLRAIVIEELHNLIGAR
jgi:acetaldehyde dehydrogenase / alcohol dehydrogenase